MNQLEAALAARAFRDGAAKRTAIYRHRRFVAQPLAIVALQLGAEPFSAAALGFGVQRSQMQFTVSGEPLNRDLAFAALSKFAQWFNPRFESPANIRMPVQRGDRITMQTQTVPQVLLANEATLELLGRIGRRLAYLPAAGPRPAPLELVRLGRHLTFLSRHAAWPGQQLVVCLTQLMNAHWATAQSAMERLSLGALDAFIEPPMGIHGFHAAVSQERDVVGPVPAAEDDQRLEPLLKEFNRLRDGRTDPATITPLLFGIEEHYRPLIERAWELVWRCWNREASCDEAPSTQRRWETDCEEYTNHIDWLAEDGRRRTRQTPRQAAMLLRNLEEAKKLLDAEEACDDPVRMVPYLLEGKAIKGQVTQIDTTHKELIKIKRMARPLLRIHSADPCLMPKGKELWWSKVPSGPPFIIHDIQNIVSGGSVITLKLMTSTRTVLPRIGDEACFSIHTTDSQWMVRLPPNAPWTHVESTMHVDPASLEDET
jgi:hypothetical protein